MRPGAGAGRSPVKGVDHGNSGYSRCSSPHPVYAPAPEPIDTAGQEAAVTTVTHVMSGGPAVTHETVPAANGPTPFGKVSV